MSLFLGPVHHWLYGKIKHLESLELNLRGLDRPDPDMFLSHPLEDVVDPSRIHASLQEMIHIAETRFAQALHAAVAAQGEAAISEIFNSRGAADAQAFTESGGETTLRAIQKALNDHLLDGMPCDTLNNLRSHSAQRIDWTVPDALHAPHWQDQGLDVTLFYRMKAFYINAFLQVIDASLRYDYTVDEGTIVHTIRGGNPS